MLTKIAACTLVLFAFTSAVQARVPTAVTPLPMHYFCASNPSECVAAQPRTAKWNDELSTLLHEVNRKVNASIRPKANPRGGWKISPAYGDCNDYVLTKRSRLIAMGVPAGSLRLAVTATRRGEKHLILVVRTTSGDMVLDNLSRSVRTLEATGYPIFQMSTADPKRWTRG